MNAIRISFAQVKNEDWVIYFFSEAYLIYMKAQINQQRYRSRSPVLAHLQCCYI